MKTVRQLKEAAVKSKIRLAGATYGGKYHISDEPGFEEGDYHVKWPGTDEKPMIDKHPTPGRKSGAISTYETPRQTHGKEYAGREAFSAELANKQFGLNVLSKQVKRTFFHPFKGYMQSGIHALVSKWNPHIKNIINRDDRAETKNAILPTLTREQRQHAARTFIYKHFAMDHDILSNRGNYLQDTSLHPDNNHVVADTGMSFINGVFSPHRSIRNHVKNDSNQKFSFRRRQKTYANKKAIDSYFQGRGPESGNSIFGVHDKNHPVLGVSAFMGHIMRYHPEDFEAAVEHVKKNFNAREAHRIAIKHGIKDPWLGYKMQKQFDHVMAHIDHDRETSDYGRIRRSVPHEFTDNP